MGLSPLKNIGRREPGPLGYVLVALKWGILCDLFFSDFGTWPPDKRDGGLEPENSENGMYVWIIFCHY